MTGQIACSWKEGYASSVDPATAYREIERIRKKNGGGFRPRDLWQENKRKSAPLHSMFTWDDSEAAIKWRDEESRHIIRHLVVVSDDLDNSSGQPLSWRPHHSVTDQETGKRVYRLVVPDIVEDEDQRAELLARAKRQLVQFRRRHKDLVELCEVFAAIDAL